MKNKGLLFLAAAMLSSPVSFAQEIDPKLTEVYQPVPSKVTPGKTNSDAPSDAIILFSGKDLNEWVSVNDTTKPALWIAEKKYFTVNKKAGNIQTKRSFTDYQLHIEWKIPVNITGKDQARATAVFF
jgi:hypothetical protein